ncbi:MAG: DUF3180 family protein [Actinomycetota bacterium]
MHATRIGTLLGVALAAVPAGWLFGRLVQAWTGVVPAVPWVLPLLLLFMAILLLLGARVARGWIEERRYDNRMDALVVARLAALAKAAAVFGAAVTGGYLGMGLLALNELTFSAAQGRAVLSATVMVTGAGVAAAALRLERSCEVPPDESEDTDGRDV